MATIVLSAAGSLLGPVGKLVGALAGNAIDHAIFGSGSREGPRLKELSITSSSYGNPIPRQFGTMRSAGTVIWSTDLVEHRDKQGGGKGKPSTASYSYSVSFAVALSSRPIERVGRIWADGNLLRGASGDLKTRGSLRIHAGLADQQRDPLMEAVLGAQCPAFRGCAYAVFEDLDLSDFGNRIPALSFEIFAGPGSEMVEAMLAGHGILADPSARFAELAGFSHEGGSLRDAMRLVDRLHPLAPVMQAERLAIAAAPLEQGAPIMLAPAAAWDEGEFGQQGGSARTRSDARNRAFAALRYYDIARGYQPGMQLAGNSADPGTTLEFPGALAASDALDLARRANTRAAAGRDTLTWRLAELDPRVAPGTLVTAPGMTGIWQVASWEWRERGIELELIRHRGAQANPASADPGSSWTPPDRPAAQTLLRVFEPPWDGNGSAAARHAHAALGATTGRWAGAALHASRDGVLLPTGQSAVERAVTGSLVAPLGPSSSLRYEPRAQMRVIFADEETALATTGLAGLTQGENRLLVGGEAIQFALAEPLGGGEWLLKGLLRGRGGTEIEAQAGHAAGTPATLLDDRLIELGADTLSLGTDGFAAIGLGDGEPVSATMENAGGSLRPPCPVHPLFRSDAAGGLMLGWTRRARGQWRWLDEVEQPLVEESESYEVGLGPPGAPLWRRIAAQPQLELAPAEVSALAQAYPGATLWVRQLGSLARSHPLQLGTIA